MRIGDVAAGYQHLEGADAGRTSLERENALKKQKDVDCAKRVACCCLPIIATLIGVPVSVGIGYLGFRFITTENCRSAPPLSVCSAVLVGAFLLILASSAATLFCCILPCTSKKEKK